MPVIIDGHNLLRTIQKLGEGSHSITALQLCHNFARYLKLTGEKGEIIFDGTGPADTSEFDNISGVEVFFAGLGSDADTIIEDKIRASTDPKRLVVVTNDRRVRKAATDRKAIVAKCEVFWTNLLNQLSRSAGNKEPQAKRWGLTDSETEQWLKLFGIE